MSLSPLLILLVTLTLAEGVSISATSDYLNPRRYGARADRFTDDAVAFQAAINEGDIRIPKGSYLINHTVLVPDYRTVQCEPGAVMLTTLHNGANTAIFRWNGTSHGRVLGCTFEGTNKVGVLDKARQFNMGVQFWGPGHHNRAIGNTFRHFWGNAGLSIYGNDSTGGSDNNVVQFCYFDTNAIYGVVVVSGRGNRLSYNRLVDAAIGLEADDLGQVNSGNVLDHNRVMCKRKCGGVFPESVFFSIGSAPKGFNYGGNRAIRNHVGHGVAWWTNHTGQIERDNEIVP